MTLTPLAAAIVAAMEEGFPRLEELPAHEGRARAAALPRPPLPPIEVAAVADRTIPGPHDEIPVRVYTPHATGGLAPVVVYFHGGGFVIGDLDTYDRGCRSLCVNTAAVVVSVDYRLAPEHPFPAAVDDALAATEWVAANADALGGDAGRLVVAGDSAGGTLATVVATIACERGAPAVRGQLLIYAGTRMGAETPSRRSFSGDGYFLRAPMIEWFEAQYLARPGDSDHPWASPLLTPDLRGLPPAHIVIAGCDPLRDEGLAYAARLREAGVAVDARVYEGMFHGFFNLGHVLPEADAASSAAYAAVRAWFAD